MHRKKLSFKSLLKYIFIIIVSFHLFFIGLISIFIVSYNYINPTISGIKLYRQVFYGYKNKGFNYISLKSLPWYVPRMLIAVEDYKFREHNGFDFDAIETAIRINKAYGYNMSGGSTLNQQLARTLFLFPKKFMIRKYLELIIALEMNAFMPKDRILELYLNNVEWGKGIYGIEKASLIYYKKSARYLTSDEAARLFAVLSSPLKFNPNNFFQSSRHENRYNFLSGLY